MRSPGNADASPTLLTELAKVKALFQLRAIAVVIGAPMPMMREPPAPMLLGNGGEVDCGQ